MSELADYVVSKTERGECGCGCCLDRGERPAPAGHTADVHFFKVAARDEPDAATFRRLTGAHYGAFAACDPFDGKEHSYMELGGWLGDQGVALQYMGLGTLLGQFKLLTPASMLPRMPSELQAQMAGAGYVTVKRAE